MHLKTANDIINDIRVSMRDTLAKRWTEDELWQALNRSIQEWSGRVSYPATYSFGYVSNETELDIPYYIQGDIRPQIRDYANYDESGLQLDVGGNEVWKDVPTFEVLEDEDGTRKLVLPGSGRRTEIRCIYWVSNGPLPQVTATVPSGGWLATDTTLTVDVDRSMWSVPMAGYIKVGAEYIFYEGVTQSSGSVTLANCSRGTFGTVAAAPTSGTGVYWCVAAPKLELFGQLDNQMMAKMHAMFITDASPKEIEHHTFMMRWYSQMVDSFWRKHVPTKPHLSHNTMRSQVRKRVYNAL